MGQVLLRSWILRTREVRSDQHDLASDIFFNFLLDIFFIYISNAIPKVPYTLPAPLLPYPPTPTSWPWHSPVLGHIKFARPRASLPNDGRLETQVQGVLISSYYCSTCRVAGPFGSWVLSLAPPMGAWSSIL